jgi:DNA invertase Pin-like site-specific DNA recombinase
MKAAFGYLRVSSVGQADDSKDGLVRQKEAIKKYAAAHDLYIKRWFTDTITGKTEIRPALEEMIEALDSNGVKTVVIERLERLARKLTAQEAIIARLQLSGYILISTAEPNLIAEDDDDLDSAMRTAMRQMLGIFAELDRKSTVHKLRAARERARKTRPDYKEGRKFFGFRVGEPETIQRVVELHSTGLNLSAITRQLNQEGCKTREGGIWYAQQVSRILERSKKIG